MTGLERTEDRGNNRISSDAEKDGQPSSPEKWYNQGRIPPAGAISYNSLLSLADQVVASATNFLTGIIIARVCIKEELGIYMLGFSIMVFVLDLQTSFISAPYMVYSQRLHGREHAVYMGSSFTQQLALALLVVLSLSVGMVFVAGGFGSVELGAAMKALELVICFMMLREFVRRILFAGFAMRTAFTVDCMVAVFQLGGLVALARLGLLSARTAFYCIGFSCGITTLGWLIFYRRSYSFKLKQLWPDFKNNLSFGKWILASSLLWAVSMTIYPWLLAWFHGTAATGVWAACWGITAIANPLLLGIQNFLGPKIVQSYTRGGAAALRSFVVRVSVIYFFIIAPPALILFIFGGRLVVMFYGSQYVGNDHVIAILAVNLLVMAASFTMSRALLAMEEARAYFMANIVPLILILTIGVLLVKRFGPAGVAWGFLLGTGTTAATMFWLFAVLIKRSVSEKEVI